MTVFSRRQALALMGGLSLASLPYMSFAQGTGQGTVSHGTQGRKFIFVILRGAMDGLSAVMPRDNLLEDMRDSILPDMDARLNLNGDFTLHPAFAGLHKLYSRGDAAFIHASATSYRNRSHFEAQDALETLGHTSRRDGWLNRALQANGAAGLSVAHSIPLALKGAAPVSSWSPQMFKTPSDDLLERLSDIYASDSILAPNLAAARDTDMDDAGTSRRDARRFARKYTVALSQIGKLMSADGGPDIGMVALSGWDTHANQKNDLTRKFTALDEGLTALQASLGPSWAHTCVVVCSEFGRTVAANGTKGTDHGTGGLTMLLGGAVKGGGFHGDWPGLKQQALYEGRDLYPANDISAILKGVLRDHLGIERRALDANVFPNSARAFDGLIQA